MKRLSVTSWVCMSLIAVFGIASLWMYLQLKAMGDTGGWATLILYMMIFCLMSSLLAWPIILAIDRMNDRRVEKWAAHITPEQKFSQTRKNKIFIRAVLAVFGLYLLILIVAPVL